MLYHLYILSRYHVSYAPAKFEVAASNGFEEDAFSRNYIILPLTYVPRNVAQYPLYSCSGWKIVSEYDQEIPQSQTADDPVAPRGRAPQPSRDKGRQIKQSNQLSLPHQDEVATANGSGGDAFTQKILYLTFVHDHEVLPSVLYIILAYAATKFATV